MWTRLSWRLAGTWSCALISSVQASSYRARSATVQREVAPAQPEESEPGGNSVNGKPNTPSSKPNTSSSAGKEKRLGESRLCGVSGTGEDASGMSTGEDTSVGGGTRKPVSVSKVGWKRGGSGGGCGGGSGEATMDAGVKSDEAVTNFCPGRRVPSLQVGVTGRRVHAVKVAARAGEGVVGGGHSSGVVGQQSQSISSSIWSNVRPLFAAYIIYTFEGVVVGVPPLSFQRSIQRLSAAAIVSLVAMPFLRYR